MVLQTLPPHNLFSQGPYGRRKLWSLLLTHLTLISMRSLCSTCSSNCALVKWGRASRFSPQPALGSWLGRSWFHTRSEAPGLTDPEVWVASGHYRGEVGTLKNPAFQRGKWARLPCGGHQLAPPRWEACLSPGQLLVMAPGQGAHAGGLALTPGFWSQHVAPASDSFFLFVLGLGGINKIVTVIRSRQAPSRTGKGDLRRQGGEGLGMGGVTQ